MTEPQWKADAAMEALKLTSSHNGWNLPGSSPKQTRTRNGGNGRPNLSARRLYDDSSSSSESSYSYESRSDSSASLSGYISDNLVEKPPTTRVILEIAGVRKAFEENCFCQTCKSRLLVEFNSVCLATSIILRCSNISCGYVYHGESPAKANLQVRNFAVDRRERSTDYAINILYVLGILSVGDGSVEAGRLCGLLSLPRDTSMERRSFPIIEDRIGPAIRELQEEILLATLVEEVRLSMEQSEDYDDNDFMLWSRSLSDPSFVLGLKKYPKLHGSFDMGWQQRSSGHIYNSPSGHALIVGRYTRKAIAMCIKSKLCNYCHHARKKLPCGPIGRHDCCQNYAGSSGGMEPTACLDMVVDLYDNKQVILSLICCDDDASTRSMLQWSNADHKKNYNLTGPPQTKITKGKNKGKLQERPDRGLLPGHIPEPLFVADPNHRKKVLTGELLKLKMKKMDERLTMTRMDVMRLGKNFGYMIRAIPKLQECQYINAGKAVLEHHFDNHEFCGPWCRRKDQTMEEREATKRYYRSKELDNKLYVKLEELVSRFITLERLLEVAHGMDTQVNESFNNTATWFAPKNRVYCGSHSLRNRLGMAVGINSIGFVKYFTRLYWKMGITMEPPVLYFLQQKDRSRSKRLADLKKKEVKKQRMAKKFSRLKDDEIEARKARMKRAGTYRRGMNMDVDGCDDDDEGNNNKPSKKSRKDVVCPFCGKRGHTTKRSKHCDKNPNNELATDPTTNDEADDIDAMDRLPLDGGNDGDGDDSDMDLFFDVGTWSDEEEGTTVAFI